MKKNEEEDEMIPISFLAYFLIQSRFTHLSSIPYENIENTLEPKEKATRRH